VRSSTTIRIASGAHQRIDRPRSSARASAPACRRARLRPPRRRTMSRASRLRNRRLRFTRKPCRRKRTCIRSPGLQVVLSIAPPPGR
jgi:hypothetical protein